MVGSKPHLGTLLPPFGDREKKEEKSHMKATRDLRVISMTLYQLSQQAYRIAISHIIWVTWRKGEKNRMKATRDLRVISMTLYQLSQQAYRIAISHIIWVTWRKGGKKSHESNSRPSCYQHDAVPTEPTGLPNSYLTYYMSHMEKGGKKIAWKGRTRYL